MPSKVQLDPAYADDGKRPAAGAPPPRPPSSTKPWTAQEYDTSAGRADDLDLTKMLGELKGLAFDKEF